MGHTKSKYDASLCESTETKLISDVEDFKDNLEKPLKHRG
jgi:hypothetical protein